MQVQTCTMVEDRDSNLVVLIYVTTVTQECGTHENISYDYDRYDTQVWVIPYSTLNQDTIDKLLQHDTLIQGLSEVSREYCHSTDHLPYIFHEEIAFVTNYTHYQEN